MQYMDTLAPTDSNDLDVVFNSTTPAQGLQVRSEDSLYSRAALPLLNWVTPLIRRMRSRVMGKMTRR